MGDAVEPSNVARTTTRPFGRRLIVAVMAALLVIIGGLILYILQVEAEQTRALAALQQTQRERNLAQAQVAASERVRDFLSHMLSAVAPADSQSKPVLLLDVLDKAAQEVGPRFANQPVEEAQVR